MKEQIEEMVKDLCDIECKGMKCNECDRYGCEYRVLAEALYNAGYRKQKEGEWAFEVNHSFDDYGDLTVYATAYCAKCKKNYPFNPTVAREYISRPENLGVYEDWDVDVEPIKAEVLKQARANKNLYPFCPNCGAKMKGGAE